MTVQGPIAASLGVPKDAVKFAFSYPLPLAKLEAEALINLVLKDQSHKQLSQVVVDGGGGSGTGSSGGGSSSSRSGGSCSATHHAASGCRSGTSTGTSTSSAGASSSSTRAAGPGGGGGGSPTPPWLDFVLIGGFVYFDARGKLLQCNALGISQAVNDFRIGLDGPHDAALGAGVAMQRDGRMQAVTVESLKAAGFHSFGWLNPSEMPGGELLDEAMGLRFDAKACVERFDSKTPERPADAYEAIARLLAKMDPFR